MIHTDTLNESGFVEDTIAAFKGRTIHAFHTEGAGGGHAPDIIKVAGLQERAAVLHQPDAALHGEHAGRASRHAHGVPPPRRQHPRGHRLRREPHPPRDHRRRGHPARPRRALDDLLRQPGHGPRRRGADPHLADGAQDEGAARAAEGGRARQRQLPRQALHRQVHHQPGDRPGRGARAGLAGGRQARRPGAVEPGVLRREARPRDARRHHRRRAHGRPQRLDPDAAAGALPADVRRLRPRASPPPP